MGGCLSIEGKGVAKEVRDLYAEIERLRVTSHEKDLLLVEKDLELARTSAAIRDLVRGQEERDKKVRARDATLLEKDDAIAKEKAAYLNLLKVFGRLERRAALTGRVVRLRVSQLPLDTTTRTLYLKECAFQRRVSISYVRSETVFAVISITVGHQPRVPFSLLSSPQRKERKRKSSLAPDDEEEEDSADERTNVSNRQGTENNYGLDQTFVFFPAGCISAPYSISYVRELGDVTSLRTIAVSKTCVGTTGATTTPVTTGPANNAASVKANRQLLPLLDVPPPQAPSRSGSGVGAGLMGVPIGGKKPFSTPRAGGTTVSTPRHRYGSSHANTPAGGCSPQPQQQQQQQINPNKSGHNNRPSSVSLAGVGAATREASMSAATAPYYVPVRANHGQFVEPRLGSSSDFSRCLIEWSIVGDRSDYANGYRCDEGDALANMNAKSVEGSRAKSAGHGSLLPPSSSPTSLSVTHSIAVGFASLHTAEEHERRANRKGQRPRSKRSEKKAEGRRGSVNAPFGNDDTNGNNRSKYTSSPPLAIGQNEEKGACCYDTSIGGLNIGESVLSSSRSSSSASSATSTSSSSSASSSTASIEARSKQNKIVREKEGSGGGRATSSANSSPLALCSTGKSAAFNNTENTQHIEECAPHSSSQQPRPIHESKRSFTIVYSIEESSGKESWWLSMAGQKVCDLSPFFTSSKDVVVGRRSMRGSVNKESNTCTTTRVAALLDLRPHRADSFSDETKATQGIFVGGGEGGVGIVKKREANAVSTNVSNPNTIKPFVHLNTPRHLQHSSLPQTAASLSALPTVVFGNGGGAAAYRPASRGGTASVEPETDSTEEKSGAVRGFGSGPYSFLPAPPHSPPKRSASLNALQYLRSQQQASQGKEHVSVNRLGSLALRGPTTIHSGIGERVGTCSSEESCSPLATLVPPLPLFPMLRENTANPTSTALGCTGGGGDVRVPRRQPLDDEEDCFGVGQLKVFLGIPAHNSSSFLDEERAGSRSPKAAASVALPTLRPDDDADDDHDDVEDPADKNRLWKKKLVKGGVTRRVSGVEVPRENEHMDPYSCGHGNGTRTGEFSRLSRTAHNNTPPTPTFHDPAAVIALPHEAPKYERIGGELDGGFLFKVPTTRRARHKEITGKFGSNERRGDKKEKRPLLHQHCDTEGLSKNIQQVSIAAVAVPVGGADGGKPPAPAGTAAAPSVTVGTVSASHLMRHTTTAPSAIATSSACWGSEGGEGGGAPPFSFGSSTPRTGAGGRKRPNSRGGVAGGEKTLLMVKKEADAAAAAAATALLEEKERGEKERAAQRGGAFSAATFGTEPAKEGDTIQQGQGGLGRVVLSQRLPLSYCPIVSSETRTSCRAVSVGSSQAVDNTPRRDQNNSSEGMEDPAARRAKEVANMKREQTKERKTYSVVLHRILFDDDIPEMFVH